jgi:flavin reductase (DIM6/NTAB) family NADH-FMN oxidoreductase RutF
MVTSAAEGQRNVMAAAWVMPVDFDPPKLAIVIDAGTLTRRLVEAAGGFGLTVPAARDADLTHAVGNVSGREGCKFARWGIATWGDAAGRPPRLCAGIAWLECRLIAEPGVQTAHDLFVARVTAAWADPRVFADGRWRDSEPGLRTLHHIAGGAFFVAGEIRQALPLPDAG